MTILERQFSIPTHIAWPIRLSQEASEPWEAGACLLLAAHRWMRLLRVAKGEGASAGIPGRFTDLMEALEGSESGLPASLGDLIALAQRFLDPHELCKRRDDQAAALVVEIEVALGACLGDDVAIRMLTSGPSLPGRILEWRGPGGHGTGPGALDGGRATTWVATGGEGPRAIGPAVSDGDAPYPLILCPGARERPWFECAYGGLYDADGVRAVPAIALTAGRSLGRLLAWTLTRESDGAELAVRLADAGMKSAAAELRLLTVAARVPRFDAQAVAEVRDFVERCGVAGEDAVLDAWLLRQMASSEARLRESGDFRGLTEVLLARQQMETGDARARTLRRVATLFHERLEDPESAIWCLLSYLEDNAADEETLAEVGELLPRTARPDQTAGRLDALAAGAQGRLRSRLAQAAAEAWQVAKRPGEALRAWMMVLEVDPNHVEAVSRATELSNDDPEARLRLLALRRDGAQDRGDRIDAAAERASLLAAQGRVPEAREEWRRVLDEAPDRVDAFDALVDAMLADGDRAAAIALGERLAGRIVAPGARSHVLLRLADLLGTTGLSVDRSEVVMAEALALDPGHPELVEALAGIYADRGAWHAHLAVLGRIVATVPERAEATLMRMAEVALDRMDDPLASLSFLSAAAARAPNNPEPRRRIEDLHERLGLWAEVSRDLEARAQAPGEGRLDTLIRLADVYEHRLSLRERTKETLWMALREAPPARAAGIAHHLAELHRADGERGRELDALEVAVQVGTDDEQTAELLVSMGRRALETPADASTARRLLEEALRRNPVHPVAVELLCGLWLDAGHPERVVAVAEPLARKAAQDGDIEREARVRRMAGDAAARCNDTAAALAQFARVVELDPSDRVTRARLGRKLARLGRHAEAVAVLEECLGDASGCEDREELLGVAADCALAVGQAAQALAWLEEIGAAGAADAGLLRRRVEAAARAGDARRQAAHLEPLVALEAAGPVRFAGLMKLGDLYRDALADPATAVRWYQAAASEGVSTKAALHKALDAAVAADQRVEALGILQSMLAAEPDGHAQARLHHASALLARELGDAERMREHLLKAVDLDPDLAEAVSALEEALADDPAGRASLFDRLARHYRLSGQSQRLVEMLRRLGGLFLELHNPALAVDALRQVLDRVPDDLEARTVVADTLTRMPGREEEALEAHRAVTAADPTRVESYRAIRELCLLAGDEDGAWCAAGALSVLGQATDDERAAFAQRRQPTLRLRRDTLPPDGFVQWILDPDAADGVARVLSLLYGPLTTMLPLKRLSDLGLTEANRVDPEAKTLFASMAQAASRVFDVRLPRIYHAPGRSGLAKVALHPPALVVGDDVLTAWRGKELRFALGRAVVAFAPGHELVGMSDAAGIRVFFLAALKIAFPDFPVPSDTEGIEEMAADLSRRLSPAAAQELREVLTRFRQGKRAIDIHAFLAGVDRTASRAGLFLANDIEIAAAQLQEDGLFLSELEYGDRLVDLCAWSVSSHHMALRRAMLKPAGE